MLASFLLSGFALGKPFGPQAKHDAQISAVIVKDVRYRRGGGGGHPAGSRARRLTLCERALQQVRLEGFELTAVAIVETADLHLRWPAKGDHLGIVIPAPKLHCGGVKLLGDPWVGHQAINDIHEKSSVVCGAG